MLENMTGRKMLELSLVLACLLTSVLAALRLLIQSWWTERLARRFRKRLALVDPNSEDSVYPFWGLPFSGSIRDDSAKDYIRMKGRRADPELVELERRLNVPFRYGWLNLALVPGGYIAAVVLVYLFENVLKHTR